MDLRLNLRFAVLTITLSRSWRLLAGVWSGGHTAWIVVGPLAIILRTPRWPGDRR